MTATDIITICDKLKPNDYEYSLKRKWLDRIEAKVRHYAHQYSKDDADMSFIAEENPVLFLDDSFGDVYIFYLKSMIDLANQEYDIYSNNYTLYNNALDTWKKQYRREHKPDCDVSVRI